MDGRFLSTYVCWYEACNIPDITASCRKHFFTVNHQYRTMLSRQGIPLKQYVSRLRLLLNQLFEILAQGFRAQGVLELQFVCCCIWRQVQLEHDRENEEGFQVFATPSSRRFAMKG